MLLAADWDDQHQQLASVDGPTDALSAPKFFGDLINALTRTTPFDLHQDVRTLRDGEPPGGLPPVNADLAPDEALDADAFE